MKLCHFLPLITVLGQGCQSDEESAVPLEPRPEVSAEEQIEINRQLSEQKIGRLLDGRIAWMREGGFEKGGLDRAPKQYLFYFSASW